LLDIETRPTQFKKVFPARFYDTYFVTEYGKLESLRASRYNTVFSVVLINITGFEGRLMLEDSAALEFMRKAAATILDSVRNCDVAGLADERQVVVILPETDYFGSLITLRKLSKALTAVVPKDKSDVSVVLTQATFPKDGKGYGELLGTAMRRSSERRESYWEKMDLRGKLFWEIVGELSGKVYRGYDNSSFDAGGAHDLTGGFIDQINELVVGEVARAPQRRGILYLAAKKITPALPLVKGLSGVGATATKIFLVGETDESAAEIKNASMICLDDPRMRETFFTFFMSEDSAYALICKENWGATYSCFHSADPYLVEGLITKFQVEYSLQEQFG
jgi:hypothetical protein